ncbi:MAG: chromosomal replication initiator protein DnaA [Acutalibacteraceae bacterium]|jgi:chromosomal replication initiator protein
MKNITEAWEAVVDYLRGMPDITEVAIKTWIVGIQPHSIEKDRMVLFVNNDFNRRIILDNYADRLQSAMENVLGLPLIPDVRVVEAEKSEDEDDGDLPDAMNLYRGDVNYEYSFENFIVGSSNKYAHAAAQAVAKNPAGMYNPLFIYGGSGLGKTHLMYAICNEIARSHPEMKILYTKGEDMVNEFIESMPSRNKSATATAEFRAKYRQVDILLVDDIQFLSGREATQEEFFHTFETLHQANKQIVLTSDRPPKDIATLEDRLRSRFEMGLLADIQPPDLETRIAIIKRKARLFDIDIEDDVAAFIAGQLKNNVRQLEGAIKRLQAQSSLTGERATITMAQAAIRDIQSDNPPVEVVIDRIIEEVARTMNVTAEDIRSDKRDATIARARQLAIYAVRSVIGLSMNDIGKHFGNRDHSTVVYNVRKTEKLIHDNPTVKAQVQDIIKNVGEG